MTVGHLFDLASVTKVMATTWAMMLLVDQGLLDLDAPVHTYLPDFRGLDKDRITVRDLLTHRSGLHRWKPVYYHAGTPPEAYAFIRDLPLEFGVGEDRRYSDLGFMLAGYLVEAVSGRPLDQFLHQELYGPLGLARTGSCPHPGPREEEEAPLQGPLGPRLREDGKAPHLRRRPLFALSGEGPSSPSPGEGPPEGEGGTPSASFAATSHGNPYEKRMVEDDSFGYLCDEDPDEFTGWRTHTLQGEVNDGNAWYAHQGVAGHAGLFSTASDLGVILGVLLEGGRHGSRRMVREGVVEEFLTPDTLTGNGVGWAMSRMERREDTGAGEGGETEGVRVFSHSGFTGTYVLGVPELGLALVFLSNRQNVGVNAEGFYPDAAEVYLPLVRRLVEAAASRDSGHPRGLE
jgi:serine-type D-Ala-D-Ala carboxypeptidase